MDTDILHYFIVTAELEHMTNAAEQLHLSQPSLSLAIRKLEESLGVRLFDRKGRGIELNKFGKAYYDRLKPAMELIQEGTDLVLDMKHEVECHIVIHSPSLFSFNGLMDDIWNFNPNIRFSHVEGSFSDISYGLQTGSIDFAVVSSRWEDPSLNLVKLRDDELVIIAGSRNHLADQEEVSLEALNDEQFITLRKNTINQTSMIDILSTYNVELKVAYDVVNLKDMLAAVSHSVYLAVASRQSVMGSEYHNLRMLSICGTEPIYCPLYLCWGKGKSEKSISKKVREILVNYFATHK